MKEKNLFLESLHGLDKIAIAAIVAIHSKKALEQLENVQLKWTCLSELGPANQLDENRDAKVTFSQMLKHLA